MDTYKEVLCSSSGVSTRPRPWADRGTAIREQTRIRWPL